MTLPACRERIDATYVLCGGPSSAGTCDEGLGFSNLNNTTRQKQFVTRTLIITQCCGDVS